MNYHQDKFLLYITAILAVWGVIFIFSAYSVPRLAYYWAVGDLGNLSLLWYCIKPVVYQLLFLLLGVISYYIIWKTEFFDYKKNLKKYLSWLVGIGLLVLGWVILQKKIFHLGVNRWIWGPKRFIISTGLIITIFFLFLSYQMAKEKLPKLKLFIFSSLYIVGLLLQPDKGTAFLFITSILLLLFFRKEYLEIGTYKISTSLLGILIFFLVSLIPLMPILKKEFIELNFIPSSFQFPHSLGYVATRLNNWLNPFYDVEGRSYQIAQSLYAINRGNYAGVGYGFGFRKTYLGPTAHTDFIFSGIGEELGLIGALVLITITLLMILRLTVICYELKGRFEKFFTLLVIWQLFLFTFVNAGMAVNLVPSKGWPYLLISYSPMVIFFFIIQIAIIQAFIKNQYFEEPKKAF